MFNDTLTERVTAAAMKVPIRYGDVRLDAGYRVDFLVENCVIVD
jgi:PD-(D/E)XK nuclease superfamily protein